LKTGSVVGIGLVLVAGGLCGWIARSWKSPAAAHDEEAADEIGPGDMSVEVVTAKAVKGDLPIVLPVIGVVRADEDALVTLSSASGGRVEDLAVRTGDDVKAGDEILRFDLVPLKSAADQAAVAVRIAASELDEFDRVGRDRDEADLDAAAQRAETAATAADAQLARITTLRKDGLASERAADEAQQTATNARRDRDLTAKAASAYRTAGADLRRARLAAALDGARLAEEAAKYALAGGWVKSPADGRIVTLPVRVGDRVETGAAVGTLLRPDGRVIIFGVTPESAAGLASKGLVNWSDPAGAARTAKIRRIAGDVTGPAGLVEIVAVPDGAAPQPGLVVRGGIVTKVIEGAIIVPAAAVVRSDDEPTVAVVGSDGIAKRVAVEVLGRHGDDVAVSGGVKDGDAVIVEGGYNLPDGARTRERESKSGKPEVEKPK